MNTIVQPVKEVKCNRCGSSPSWFQNLGKSTIRLCTQCLADLAQFAMRDNLISKSYVRLHATKRRRK